MRVLLSVHFFAMNVNVVRSEIMKYSKIKALQFAIDMMANNYKQDWFDYAKGLLIFSKNELNLKTNCFFDCDNLCINVDFVLAYPYLMNDKKENFILIFKNGYFKDIPIQNETLNRFDIRVGIMMHRGYERNISIEKVQKIYQKVYDDLQNSFKNIQEVILDDFAYKGDVAKIEMVKIVEKSLEMYNAEVLKNGFKRTDNKKYEFDFEVVFKAVDSNNSDDLEIMNKLKYSIDKDFNGVNVKINLLIHLQKETKYMIDNYHILSMIENVLREVEVIFNPEIEDVKQ